MDDLALERGTAGQRSPTDRNGMLLEILFELGAATVISREMAGLANAAEE